MQPEEKRQITVHGLITHYGTARAKYCAIYLHKYMPKLYAKPKIHVYFDQEWIDFVKEVRDKLGDIHKKLWYLKYPVIIFFNNKYVGDHRTLVHYVNHEHGIVPDLPRKDLFPDFTQFIPKRRNKDYVYLDIRVGDLNDYVVGKMVFELHADIVPQTCKFFKYLCEPFGEYQFSEPERRWKFSYLGTTIRRICGHSFIQGGAIPEAVLLKVKDENFNVKHNKRGVLSIANQGGNRSSTEFVISLKPNPFMDRNNVAFGHLIFGEPVLAAIEKIPTYYQSPLNEIVVVGCGVIPSYDLWDTVDFETSVTKQKQKIITEVQELKKKMQQICDFKEKVQKLLKEKERERSIEFIYTDKKISDTDIFTKDNWTKMWLRETCQIIEEENEPYDENIEEEGGEEFEFDDDLRSDIEEECKMFEESLGSKIFTDLTVDQLFIKRRRKDVAQKKRIMHEFISSVLEKMFEDLGEEEPHLLENIPVKEIPDELDVRDVPSELVQERYEAGLYSLPGCLRKTLVEIFNSLTPAQLKLLGLEIREILKEGGISEESLSIYGSEDLISGIVLAVTKAETLKHGFYANRQDSKNLNKESSSKDARTLSKENSSKDARNLSNKSSSKDARSVSKESSSKEQLKELIEEISLYIVEQIKKEGPNLIDNILAKKASLPSINAL